MFVVQRPLPQEPIRTTQSVSEPSSVKSELDQLIIKPLRENFNKLIKVVAQSDASEQLISRNYSLIKDNRIRTQTALDQIKQASVQESIASLGLRGFHVKIDIEGIQLDITATPERQSKFMALLREYVFLYSRSRPWPPSLETGYKLFKYNAPERENICFYWNLYGYLLRMFLDKSWKVNLTDLFLLKNMKAYCSDPFEVKKKKEDTVSKEKKEIQTAMKLMGFKKSDDNKEEEQKEETQVGGDENKKSMEKNIPSFIDPVDEEEKRREENALKKEAEGMSRTIEDDIRNRQVAMISSFAQQCDPQRFKLSARFLKRNLVEWEVVSKQKVTISEFDAFESIVVKYVRNDTILPDSELLVGAQKNQTVAGIYYQHDTTKKWSKTISFNEPAITDPLLGVTYSWGNLIQWFGYPQKTQNKGKTFEERNNPREIVSHLLAKFRSSYSLNSAMFKLDEKTLSDIRGRFLKFLEMIFTLLRDLYVEVEKKFEETHKNMTREKDLESRSRDFMLRLNQEIAKADDPSRRLRLEKIKVEASQKLKPFLSS